MKKAPLRGVLFSEYFHARHLFFGRKQETQRSIRTTCSNYKGKNGKLHFPLHKARNPSDPATTLVKVREPAFTTRQSAFVKPVSDKGMGHVTPPPSLC